MNTTILNLKRLAIGGLVLALGCALQIANADPAITPGSRVGFLGGFTMDDSILTATAITNFYGLATGQPVVLETSQLGTYSPVPGGTETTFQVFTFNPAPMSAFEAWSFTSGGATYNLEVNPGWTITPPANGGLPTLRIEGTGTAGITGYAPTPATWQLVCNGAGVSASGSFTLTVVAVPEPSSSALMLLGLVPVACAIGWRKNARA